MIKSINDLLYLKCINYNEKINFQNSETKDDANSRLFDNCNAIEVRDPKFGGKTKQIGKTSDLVWGADTISPLSCVS